jgi:hypothetical protein
VNVLAFFLQAFVSSRLIKYKGLRGGLLALPLVALGGYSIIAAGAGLSLVPLDQDCGERDRLLNHELCSAAALAADHARREIQGALT